MSKTPATVVTGFLGAGKTTIISHLVEALVEKGKKPAYIKNELGEVDLDAKLFQGLHIQAKELLNGCICCTLVGPFISAINELLDTYQPDVLLIESAGTADPASLALMVSTHPRLYRDGVISIIDVLNFEGYADISLVAQRQAELTDLLVFNKVELVDNERKQAVVGYVRELNQKAPIVEAPAGVLNPDLAFGIFSNLDHQQLSHSEHDHLNEDHIQARHWETSKTISKKKLLQVLETLPKNIFRVKGFLQSHEEGFEVINGVFTRFEFFQPPAGISPQTQLIFIGFQIDQNWEDIRAQLESL